MQLVRRAKAYHGFDGMRLSSFNYQWCLNLLVEVLLLQNSLIRWWSKVISVDSLPNHMVLGGVSCLSVQRHKVMLKCNMFKNIKDKSKSVSEIWSMSDFKGCVESLSSSDGWMAGPVLSNIIFKEFDSRLSAHEWNRKAKEEINLQKDVQVSVQALEQVRDFDSKLGSQLKTIDEGDGYSEWQWDCHIPFIRRDVYAKEEINLQKDVQVSVQALEQVRDFDSKLGSQLKTIDEVEAYADLKKIMKELQAWLKVKLREVRRDKRKQGDAEDEHACSSIKRCRHKVRVMDLDQTGGVL
ncbi:hypothetical protein DY000_02012247 [Brassica cretica]|uniref:CCR4-Not complex component Not N-terminal domain-containing protein n=1 Tax=Brassica cretica TaxID=69181 RepID=A0ABQ7CVP8_BRACR|nr:hypothetical protein DY000_02012247 [Brassica cretica]